MDDSDDSFKSPFQDTTEDTDFNTLMAGYEPARLNALPSPVCRLLQNQGAAHFWQKREVCVFNWMEPAPSDVRLIVWDGRKAELVPQYQTARHNHQTLFVFRKPSANKPKRKHRGGASPGAQKQSRYEEWEKERQLSQHRIDEGKPLSLAISRLGWDKNRFDLGRESMTGWVDVVRADPYDGQRLEIVVKAASDTHYRDVYARFKVRLKSGQSHYRFTVTDLDTEKALDRNNGGLRFKAGLEGGHAVKGDHLFSDIATCVRPSQLTLAQFAEQLCAIEAEQGYEAARLAARQLDYQAMCELVNARGLADNDPNLMPSRFMLLPGSSDTGLEAQDNLDPFPWAVHPDGPQHFSVAFLKHCLRLGGYLPSDDPWPLWQSPEDDQTDEFGHPVSASSDDLDDGAYHLAPNDDRAEFDAELQAAYQDFLDRPKARGAARPSRQARHKKERTYRVQAGDTLDSIARNEGYPYWQILFSANADSLENPDRLQPGQEIRLPVLDTNPMKDWLTEQGEANQFWTGKGGDFPADYLSITLEDSQGRPLEGSADRLQVYRATETEQRLFYDWALSGPTLQFLLPMGEDIRLAGIAVDRYQEWQPFSIDSSSGNGETDTPPDTEPNAEVLTPMGLFQDDTQTDTDNTTE